jgi:hypothetical protein
MVQKVYPAVLLMNFVYVVVILISSRLHVTPILQPEVNSNRLKSSIFQFFVLKSLTFVYFQLSCFRTLVLLLTFRPSNGSTARIGPWPPPLRFLNHTELDTR